MKSVELCSKVQQFQDSESQLGPGALRVQCAIIVRSWGREAMCKWLLPLLPNSFSLLPNSFSLLPNSFLLFPDPHSLLTYTYSSGVFGLSGQNSSSGVFTSVWYSVSYSTDSVRFQCCLCGLHTYSSGVFGLYQFHRTRNQQAANCDQY